MSAPGSLHISFGGHRVVISSPRTEIVRGARAIFQWMLGPPVGNVVGELTVSRNGGRYEVRGCPDISHGDGSLPDTLRCLRFSAIRLLWAARTDLIWFHGGAVAWAGCAVLFPGQRGQGKSTLVTSLCADGWDYLSDEVLPVNPRTGKVLPFPQTPAVRAHPGVERHEAWLGTTHKTSVTLTRGRIVRDPTAIAAVVFPAYEPGGDHSMELLGPAAAALRLLASSWTVHEQRERAVEYVSDLAVRLPAYRLSYSSGQVAGQVVAEAMLPNRGRRWA